MTWETASRERCWTVALSLAVVVLGLCTTPLWRGGAYSAVPAVRWLQAAPWSWDASVAVVTVGAALFAALFAALGRDRLCRAALLVEAAGFLFAVALDYHRLQPWAYHAAISAGVLALASRASALGRLRLVTIGLYVHSALSKVDYSFVHGLGRSLVGAVAGESFTSQSDAVQSALVVAAAVAELLIAGALAWRPTWRIGLLGSLAMHAALLLALGPWRLNHHAAVLVWNVFFILQNLVLWLPSPDEKTESTPRTSGDRFASLLVGFAVIAPLAEPLGRFDAWPAWGLYSSRPSRAALFVRPSAVEFLPRELAELTPRDEAAADGWLQPPLDVWSLSATGAPIYPGARFQLGVAYAVVQAGLPEGSWRVSELGPADRFTGWRDRRVYRTRAELQRRMNRFLVNARPRRAEAGN